MTAVEQIGSLSSPTTIASPVSGIGEGGSFNVWLQKQVNETNNQLIDSGEQLRGLALGQTDNLHQVMMSLEKAKLSFELVLQVRNRLIEAYQDIMRIQV